MLVLQPSSAEVERGFSAMNDIKSELRTSLQAGTLDVLMRIKLCGPEIKLRHQSTENPPFGEFDALILPGALKQFAKNWCPARSSKKARPSNVAKPVKHDFEVWWVDELGK